MNRAFAVAIAVVILLVVVRRAPRDGMEVRASDQRVYMVVAAADAAAAAARLAAINAKNIALIAALQARWPDPHTRWGRATSRLAAGYRSDRLRENNPTNTVNTSYTEGKGTNVALCLRDRPDRALHPQSILEFVDLHELAHIASVEYGHGAEFWQTFEWLLGEAKTMGIHEPVDYAAHPVNYCGLDVSYNPYFQGAGAA